MNTCGMNDMVSKPFKDEQLFSVVKKNIAWYPGSVASNPFVEHYISVLFSRNTIQRGSAKNIIRKKTGFFILGICSYFVTYFKLIPCIKPWL
jgi:hypothetical protein